MAWDGEKKTWYLFAEANEFNYLAKSEHSLLGSNNTSLEQNEVVVNHTIVRKASLNGHED